MSGLETVVGRPSTLWSHQKLRRGLPGVAAAVAAVESRLQDTRTAPTERPLFLFSASWRGGSTLVQRLILSTDRYFIWGEPYHQTDVVRRLAESLLPFATGWPPQEYISADGMAVDGRTPTGASRGQDGRTSAAELSQQWVANHYPPVSRLLDAHRAFLRELLTPPPAQTNRDWGLKEVRLSADYALYLRLLFPAARFVFLVRDPHDGYRSYRERPSWFERWPRSQVRTPSAYGQVWRRLAESFLEHEQTLGALLVRYEDIIAGGEAVDRLEQVLGAPIDRSVLEHRISGSDRSTHDSPSALELRLLDRATQPIATRLGYGAARP